MSGTREALRLIELASTRLRLCIGDVSEPGLDPAPAGVTGQPGGPGKQVMDPDQRSPDQKSLMRAAWGQDEPTLSSAALRVLAAGLPAGVVVDQSGLSDACVFPPPVGRIVLNLLLLAAASLPAGGTVMLAGSADDLFLRLDGPGTAWPPGMAACVVDEAAACAAMPDFATIAQPVHRGVQMPLTALLAHASGIRISFLIPPSRRVEPAILRLGGS